MVSLPVQTLEVEVEGQVHTDHQTMMAALADQASSSSVTLQHNQHQLQQQVHQQLVHLLATKFIHLHHLEL